MSYLRFGSKTRPAVDAEGGCFAPEGGFQLFTPTVRLGAFTLDIDDASLCAL